MKRYFKGSDKMIQRIALTASMMLFALAQFFSFYVVFVSHGEKLALLEEKEEKIYANAMKNFSQDVSRAKIGNFVQDQAVTYCFRKNMPDGCALYREKAELFNSSAYEFETEKFSAAESGYWAQGREETVGGKKLLIFCSRYWPDSYHRDIEDDKKYLCFYAVDVTSVYFRSFRLIFEELFVSVLASFAVALFLVFRIKKITKPLQTVNETQRQLIGSMSHELKTPLTAIKGYSETLLGVTLSEEQKERALLYINSESGRLSRLSEKMMELTKLYEPECRILPEKISVEMLFDAAEHGVTHHLQEKGMTLVREGDYRGRTKLLDKDLMTSFLINLINNGIMASAPGQTVYLGADENVLWVRDEGCGIPSGELEKVRKAFYRVDKSRSRKSGNMGLGLALCEQIAAVHGTVMQMESSEGHGTKVFLEI